MTSTTTSVCRKPGPAARPFDEARVLKLLRDGRTATEVCAMVHVRKERIVALGRAAGIPLEWGRKRKAFNRERALELLHDGMPPYKVAVAVSAPKAVVYALADELGPAKSGANAPRESRFVCAKCGGEFRLWSSGKESAQGYTLLGGRKWCDACAKRRFRRGVDWAAPESPNAVRPGLEAWK